jgi:site-specific DNA-methyltransferase (adenine-specific)
MAVWPDECIDLTVTSPPYDDLRKYNGYEFHFEGIASQLYRVTKIGGVVVWVVADATINGSETGTSFYQALHFKELGFNLHDTMIYEVAGTGAKGSNLSYWQSFEYMFVFSKDSPKTIHRISDVKNSVGGKTRGFAKKSARFGTRVERKGILNPEWSVRPNIWRFTPANNLKDITDHPAVFPEQLAEDHIISWSNAGDVVLDPMCGSGTTLKMAKELGRHWIGIDISEEYCKLSQKRVDGARIPFPELTGF